MAYEMIFYLTNFIGSHVKMVENENGELEHCVCIPIERNNLWQMGSGRWCTWGMVQELETPYKGYTHWIKQRTNYAHCEELRKQGLQSPVFGRMKPSKFVYKKKRFPNSGNNRVEIDGDEL